jgi:hypothetical protein
MIRSPAAMTSTGHAGATTPWKIRSPARYFRPPFMDM